MQQVRLMDLQCIYSGRRSYMSTDYAQIMSMRYYIFSTNAYTYTFRCKDKSKLHERTRTNTNEHLASMWLYKHYSHLANCLSIFICVHSFDLNPTQYIFVRICNKKKIFSLSNIIQIFLSNIIINYFLCKITKFLFKKPRIKSHYVSCIISWCWEWEEGS